MRDLMFIMATFTPTEQLTDNLQESIDEYKKVPTEENRKQVAGHCQMFILNLITNGDPHKLAELLKDLETADRQSELFKINPS